MKLNIMNITQCSVACKMHNMFFFFLAAITAKTSGVSGRNTTCLLVEVAHFNQSESCVVIKVLVNREDLGKGLRGANDETYKWRGSPRVHYPHLLCTSLVSSSTSGDH